MKSAQSPQTDEAWVTLYSSETYKKITTKHKLKLIVLNKQVHNRVDGSELDEMILGRTQKSAINEFK